MVKPDVRHNYYADLELPTTASLDEIHKAYRKLALQYHPDRNSGREDECVPKFQAIQAANEVLSDEKTKLQYDADRRKAGLYPNLNPPTSRTATPSNRYTATSAYPPPPKRAPQGAPQRPPPPGGPPPGRDNGADRFSNFPRPSGAKKDPAQERANVFRAWQNMQNTSNNQERQQRYSHPNPPPPNPPPPQPGAANRPRPPPPPPPRQEPKMPREDPPRGGTKYKVPPAFDPEGANMRQSAWSAFQQSNAGKPGMPQGNSFNAPKKPFNPNDLDDGRRGRPTVNVPPNRPRGPPPTSSPETPLSPKTQRPQPEPLQTHFRNRNANDQIPFAEGNRVSTPYTKSFIGEKSDFFSDGLRRSNSTRYASSKLSPEEGPNRARARSSSPPRSNNDDTPRQATFEMPTSSDESGSDANGTPEEVGSSPQNQQRPGTAPNMESPFARPKKAPVPPSSRFNGTRSGPGSPQRKANGAAGRAQSDGEHPEMQQQSRSNMYADPSDSSSPLSPSSFSSQAWTSQMFGSRSTSSAGCGSSKIPKWAIPSSLNPVLRCEKRENRSKKSFVTAADERFVNATNDEQKAYLRFQSELRKEYEHVPTNLDMDIFLKLASMARMDKSSGDALLDKILLRVLLDFETVGFSPNDMANESQTANSFDYTPEPGHYAADQSRSRSEENINTTFSPDGWTGAFTGEPDYFAPPQSAGRKQPSPPRRPASNRAPTSQPRSHTMDEQHTSQSYEEVPQRPWGSDGTPNDFQRTTPSDTGFDKEGWERTFQDPTWTWPPPPPNPPSPSKGGTSSRKQSQSRKGSRPRKGHGTKTQPHVVDDDGWVDESGLDGAPGDDGDAMDIDDAHTYNQTHPGPDDPRRGARAYAVPPSEWRQQQEHKHRSHRKSSSASRRAPRGTANGGAKFNANLDDLRDSLAQSTSGADGLNLAGMGSSLPFQSQTSPTMYGDPLLPRDLVVPLVPKPPAEPQRLSKASWHAYAAAFGEYVKAFHHYNATLLQHFESRERQVQAQMSSGMGWLEAMGDTSGMITAPTGFGTYARGVKEDVKVRESWKYAWEKHTEAVIKFQTMRDRVRKLVVGGTLVEN